MFQPSFASFSNIFGRKPTVLFALSLFAVGALLAALSNNFTVLLVGRCVQGVGGGGLIALTGVIITDLVPLRERGKWFGFISGCWAIGSVTGPILGGGFSQSVNWRWIFWINLPMIGLAFVMIPPFLKLNYRTSSFMAKLRRVDWIGSFLFVSSLMSFLVPMTWVGYSFRLSESESDTSRPGLCIHGIARGHWFL